MSSSLANGRSVTLDSIREAMKAIAEIPPPPFLGSCRLLPNAHALKFQFDGREYVGAHPDFWAKIPVSSRDQYASLWAMEIYDLDLSCNANRRAEFFGALLRAAHPSSSTGDGHDK